jgi:tetratricopeptide (TPR) repeat protein
MRAWRRWLPGACTSLVVCCGAWGAALAQTSAPPAVPLAQADATPDTATLAREMRALLDAGRAAEAVSRLEGRTGDEPRLEQLLGVAYYHADRYPQAVDVLTRLRGRWPEDSLEHREAEQVLGLSLYLSGRIPDAVPYLERTRRWASGNRELLYTLGNAYIQTQRAAEAREAFARAFGLDPETAPAHVIAAQMMVRLEVEAMAEAELRQALAKDPRVAHANYLLGQLAIFRGRLDEGLEFTRRELALNPADAMAHYQLGDALVRQARWDEAIAALQQSLWLNPYYSGPYILLGRAYTKQGQVATAEGMLRRAIEYDPNNRVAHYALAQLLQQLGRVEEARREFAIAEKLPGPR